MTDPQSRSATKSGGVEERLNALGIILPPVPEPIGNFELGVIHGGVLHLSGQGPFLDTGELARGTVGADVSPDEAYVHARRTGLVLISVMRHLLGDLDQVARIIKVFGMVNATSEFTDHPKVINGCSDLLLEVFGERGRHARSAVGMGSLPRNIPVEIEAQVAITPGWGHSE